MDQDHARAVRLRELDDLRDVVAEAVVGRLDLRRREERHVAHPLIVDRVREHLHVGRLVRRGHHGGAEARARERAPDRVRHGVQHRQQVAVEELVVADVDDQHVGAGAVGVAQHVEHVLAREAARAEVHDLGRRRGQELPQARLDPAGVGDRRVERLPVAGRVADADDPLRAGRPCREALRAKAGVGDRRVGARSPARPCSSAAGRSSGAADRRRRRRSRLDQEEQRADQRRRADQGEQEPSRRAPSSRSFNSRRGAAGRGGTSAGGRAPVSARASLKKRTVEEAGRQPAAEDRQHVAFADRRSREPPAADPQGREGRIRTIASLIRGASVPP